MYSERSGMFSRFHRYLHLSYPTHLSEIWAQARKHLTCMHTSLCARVKFCAQRGPACSPDSIDILISLIWPKLAELWALAHKHIACMHASLPAWVNLCLRVLWVMLFHLFQIILNFLYVCQSVSWLTSLLTLYKYRDIASSGINIFLKFSRDIPGITQI